MDETKEDIITVLLEMYEDTHSNDDYSISQKTALLEMITNELEHTD